MFGERYSWCLCGPSSDLPLQQLKEGPWGDGRGGNAGDRLPAPARSCWKSSSHNREAASAESSHGSRRQPGKRTKRNAFRVFSCEEPTFNSANPRGTNQRGMKWGTISLFSLLTPQAPAAASLVRPHFAFLALFRKTTPVREFLRSQSCSQ